MLSVIVQATSKDVNYAFLPLAEKSKQVMKIKVCIDLHSVVGGGRGGGGGEDKESGAERGQNLC